MNTFPFSSLSCKPSVRDYGDDYTDKAVKIADYSSGYPIVNKLFTFVPKEFTITIPAASDADKTAVDAFYLANMEDVIYMLNPKDKVTYQVIFTAPPHCTPVTSTKQRIELEFRQANTETS